MFGKIEAHKVLTVAKRRGNTFHNAIANALNAFHDVFNFTGFNALPVDFLVAELGKKLPDYMIPKILIRMEEFPKNANGKIDRKALLPPDESALLSEYVAPTNVIFR